MTIDTPLTEEALDAKAKADAEQLCASYTDAKPVDKDWSEGWGEEWDFFVVDICEGSSPCPDCPAHLEDTDDEEETHAKVPDTDGDFPWSDSSECECETCEGTGFVEGGAGHPTNTSGTCEVDDCPNYGERFAEGPMMNYLYPLDAVSDSDAHKLVDLPLCIVTFNDADNDGLALTGGGMDLSWDIATAYVRLGYLPPLHFARLPAYAGMKLTDEHRLVLAAMRRSCEVEMAQARAGIAHLDTLEATMRGTK